MSTLKQALLILLFAALMVGITSSIVSPAHGFIHTTPDDLIVFDVLKINMEEAQDYLKSEPKQLCQGYIKANFLFLAYREVVGLHLKMRDSNRQLIEYDLFWNKVVEVDRADVRSMLFAITRTAGQEIVAVIRDPTKGSLICPQSKEDRNRWLSRAFYFLKVSVGFKDEGSLLAQGQDIFKMSKEEMNLVTPPSRLVRQAE